MGPELGGDLVLQAAGFTMRPLEVADADDLLAHLSDPAITEFMDVEALTCRDEALAIIAWAQSQRALGDGFRLAIRQQGDNAFAGTLGFNRLEFERACLGEVAYDLARSWQGRGVMSALLPALVDFGRGRLGLHRFEAFVTVGNEPSCRLLERCGFRREGVLVGRGCWKGAFWDQIIYGLT
jgi:RimJ/RimL family protein N-acetyltransferase